MKWTTLCPVPGTRGALRTVEVGVSELHGEGKEL